MDNPPSRPCGVEALLLDMQSPEKTLFYRQAALHSDAPTSSGIKKKQWLRVFFSIWRRNSEQSQTLRSLTRSLAFFFPRPSLWELPHSAENGQTTVVPPLHKCSVTEGKSSDDLQDRAAVCFALCNAQQYRLLFAKHLVFLRSVRTYVFHDLMQFCLASWKCGFERLCFFLSDTTLEQDDICAGCRKPGFPHCMVSQMAASLRGFEN